MYFLSILLSLFTLNSIAAWASLFLHTLTFKTHTHTHTQIRTILIPLNGLQAVPLHCDGLTSAEVSRIYEGIARSMSIQAQDASLHLWALIGAAAPKRLRADIESIQRDSKALGDQLKGILALNAAEVLSMTFETKYLTETAERYMCMYVCMVSMSLVCNLFLSLSVCLSMSVCLSVPYLAVCKCMHTCTCI
jgi:hypothetical protein